jgi:nucleotide-binding universal stress UspA family protein
MKILFCSDGSNQAENAVRFGAQIAAAVQAETSILGIAEKAGNQEPLLQALQREQDIFREHHLNAELITKAGRPVGEIVKRTRENSYDLVVIGASRRVVRGPGWMSVRTYKIIESVTPPVLVVIGDRPVIQRVLFCSSGRQQAGKSLELTGVIARSVNAVVDLIHVMDEPPAIYVNMIRMEDDADRILASNSKLGRNLRHQKEVLEQLGVFGEFRLRHGFVVPEILEETHRTDYDLVIVGSSPAKDMLRQYMMGDITREIIDGADLPVLVMRTEPRLLVPRLNALVARLFRRPKQIPEAVCG